MKKLLFSFCLCLFVALRLDAQTNIFPTSGNVGIGTTSPSAELEIKGGNGVGISLNNDQANSWDIINSQHGKLDFVRGKTNIFMRINQNGLIGINTTDPETLLNINVGSGGTNSAAGVRIGGLNNYASLELGVEGNYDGMIRSLGNNLKYYAGHWRTIGAVATEDHSHNWYTSKAGSADWSNIKMILNQDGNLGLGTSNPTSNLHISSNHNPQFQLRSELQGLWTTVNDDTNEITFNSSFYTGGSYPIVFQMGNIEKVRIGSDGNVGIGTSNPDSKLTVKGNIHTNEVKVDLLGAVAPDYVFYKDYDLKSLKAVEDYIASNGHLPNIPSAKDMETDGILLKEMNLKLLEKIEELTLYAIEQEKKLEKVKLLEKELQNQKTINTDLLEKFTSQEIRLQNIEALLNSKKQ